ncbi:MAG: tetratricopeptide repeat protein, partial [Planctomycetota bacterium]
EAVATGNLGLVCQNQGCHKEARAHYEKHLALAREIGGRRQEGYALHSLASLADDEGESDAALRLYGEALAQRRELGENGTVAETVIALGGTELEQGHHDRATAHLDEALTLAQEVRQSRAVLSATVNRARLTGGDIDAALDALREHEQRVGHSARMGARFRLWELTRDKTHLVEAKRLLEFAVEHSPEEYRASMIENVPLHRDIMRAWEERGGGQSSPHGS